MLVLLDFVLVCNKDVRTKTTVAANSGQKSCEKIICLLWSKAKIGIWITYRPTNSHLVMFKSQIFVSYLKGFTEVTCQGSQTPKKVKK